MADTFFRNSNRDTQDTHDVSPRVFSTDSTPYNVSYGEWTARWWQWAMSIPIDKNPLVDTTGEFCAEGQHGPVWFLAGTSGKTHLAERKCIIPSKESILFPIIVSQFSYSEVPDIKTEEELIYHAAKDIDRWSILEADYRRYRITKSRSIPHSVWTF